MLFANGELHYEPARLRLHVGLGRGIEVQLVERVNLIYDTRWLPPRSTAPVSRLLFHVYLDGDVEVDGVPVATPFVLFEQAAHYWGASGRRPAPLRAGGQRFSKIELTLDEGLVVLPRPPAPVVLAPGEPLLASSRAVARSLRDDPADAKREAVAGWLGALAEAGWVDAAVARSVREPASGTVARVWSALAPFVATLDLGVSLRLLAGRSGVTTRQVARNIEHLLDWSGHPVGFRTFLAEWRIRVAVMLLSAPHARIEEVATLVGYASVESMAAAFRDSGLAPPLEVKEAVSRPVTATLPSP